MVNEAPTAIKAIPTLKTVQVYTMAGLCLLGGLATGYLLGGSHAPAAPGQPASVAATAPVLPSAANAAQMPGLAEMKQGTAVQAQPASGAVRSPHTGSVASGGRMPSLQEMKQMADKQAAPLLEKLKSDPNNGALLVQVGGIYHSTHQFAEAVAYYGKAVQVEPKNVDYRTKLAISIYRGGDADGAIAQLNQTLSIDPKNANALFNLGMIRLQGKQDGKGALAAWQMLLKSNPQLSPDRKAAVLKLMADVMTTLGEEPGTRGAKQ
jgi:tetratricopeptide (TPR) repeat protein